MNPSDYPSNSYKSKAAKATTAAPTTEEKRVKKVVKAPVTIKQKSGTRKFLDNFISKDVVDIKEYLIGDVLIPTIKDTIWSAFTNTLEMTLFGGTGRARRNDSTSRPSSNYVSYSSYSSSDRFSDKYRDENRGSRSGFDPEDIVFSNIADAEAVLDQMAACIEQWGKVSVNDLYDMVDRTPPVYTATRYGWTYLDADCKPVHLRGGGYILRLPKARPLTNY